MGERMVTYEFTVWPIETMTGYEPKTSYWNLFEALEQASEQQNDKDGGVQRITDVYETLKKNDKDSAVRITELCMVMNWRINVWYYKEGERAEKLAKLYDKLFRDCDRWCCDNLKGEDLSYFFRITD